MVHALETIYQLLQPDGRLIDIHPVGSPSPIMVRSGKEAVPVGLLREADYTDYWQAEAALATVVERHLFRRRQQREFDYTTAADSAAEMLAHLDANWKRAIVDEETRRCIKEGMASAGTDRELLIIQTVRISLLRPLIASPDNHYVCR